MHECEGCDEQPQLDLHFAIPLPSHDVAVMLSRWYVLLQLWEAMRMRVYGDDHG